MLDPATVVVRAIEPLESAIEDGLMLCDVETGDILTLNATARVIWEATADRVAISAICAKLQSRYAVEGAQCLEAVTAALNELELRGFVRLTPPGALVESR